MVTGMIWKNSHLMFQLISEQVEKLQSQLNWTPIELESRQAELDKALTKLKSLSSEVDETQAALDKARQESIILRQQVGELHAR